MLNPIHDQLLLLKDNCCALIIRIGTQSHCILLTPDVEWKSKLDNDWIQTQKTDIYKLPTNMRECEELKPKSNWNLMNYPLAIKNIYIIPANKVSASGIFITSTRLYPKYFMAIESIYDVSKIDIFNTTVDNGKYTHTKIGSGKLWSEEFHIPSTVVKLGCGVQYVPVMDATSPVKVDVVDVVLHDGADLLGFDSRYSLGSHSAKYFCVNCHIDCKCKFSGSNTTYRTPRSINVNADKFAKVTRGLIKLHGDDTALKVSQGVARVPADPYAGASRIVPALLHINMGIMSKLLKHHMTYVENINKKHLIQRQIQNKQCILRSISMHCSLIKADIDKYKNMKIGFSLQRMRET